MKSRKYLSLTLLNLLLAMLGFGQTGKGMHGKILHLSGQVNIDGKILSYGEIQLSNKSKESISLETLEVKAQGDRSLYTATAEALKKLSSTNSSQLPAGDSAIFYLDIPTEQLKDGEMLSFTFTYLDNAQQNLQFQLETNFSATKPIILGAPLKGNHWTAIYSSQWQRGHRRMYYTLAGLSKIPGRFAIDFVKLDNEGMLFQKHQDNPSAYYSYDQDVLAVADGTIVSLRNNFKESKSIAANPSHTAGEASGNYLALQIGENQYAFYEHLKPGSITGKVGDRLKKEAVIAKVGFTGDASEPHLHFHLADKNSVLGAEGLPFLFKDFSYEGIFDDFSKFGRERWKSYKKDEIRNVLPSRPLPNSVISFPN